MGGITWPSYIERRQGEHLCASQWGVSYRHHDWLPGSGAHYKRLACCHGHRDPLRPSLHTDEYGGVPGQSVHRPHQGGSGTRRWTLTKLDEEALETALTAVTWTGEEREWGRDIPQAVEWLRGTMWKVCDAAIPRAKSCPRRRRHIGGRTRLRRYAPRPFKPAIPSRERGAERPSRNIGQPGLPWPRRYRSPGLVAGRRCSPPSTRTHGGVHTRL